MDIKKEKKEELIRGVEEIPTKSRRNFRVINSAVRTVSRFAQLPRGPLVSSFFLLRHPVPNRITIRDTAFIYELRKHRIRNSDHRLSIRDLIFASHWE